MTQLPSTSAQVPPASMQVPSASARVHSAAREITVGQLAARSGATVSALHFYEARGLISARRTPGNQRRYPRVMLRRVAFIRASQRVGIPLAQIKAALDTLPERRTPTARDWARLSAAWCRDLDERISALIDWLAAHQDSVSVKVAAHIEATIDRYLHRQLKWELSTSAKPMFVEISGGAERSA